MEQPVLQLLSASKGQCWLSKGSPANPSKTCFNWPFCQWEKLLQGQIWAQFSPTAWFFQTLVSDGDFPPFRLRKELSFMQILWLSRSSGMPKGKAALGLVWKDTILWGLPLVLQLLGASAAPWLSEFEVLRMQIHTKCTAVHHDLHRGSKWQSSAITALPLPRSLWSQAPRVRCEEHLCPSNLKPMPNPFGSTIITLHCSVHFSSKKTYEHSYRWMTSYNLTELFPYYLLELMERELSF